MSGIPKNGVVVRVHAHTIRQHLLLVIQERVRAEVVGEVGALVRLPGRRPHARRPASIGVAIHGALLLRLVLSLLIPPGCAPHSAYDTHAHSLEAFQDPAAPQLRNQRGRQSSKCENENAGKLVKGERRLK